MGDPDWYDRERVIQDAALAIGGKDVDALLQAIELSIGPPWRAKEKLAAAAALTAAALTAALAAAALAAANHEIK